MSGGRIDDDAPAWIVDTLVVLLAKQMSGERVDVHEEARSLWLMARMRVTEMILDSRDKARRRGGQR